MTLTLKIGFRNPIFLHDTPGGALDDAPSYQVWLHLVVVQKMSFGQRCDTDRWTRRQPDSKINLRIYGGRKFIQTNNALFKFITLTSVPKALGVTFLQNTYLLLCESRCFWLKIKTGQYEFHMRFQIYK